MGKDILRPESLASITQGDLNYNKNKNLTSDSTKI
jgi:hypothetical protein